MEQRLRDQIGRLVQSSGDKLKYRREVFDELQQIGLLKVLPLLSKFLDDPDGEYRCEAALLVLLLAGPDGYPLVLPLFQDCEDWVRYDVVGLMGEFGTEGAIEPLVAVLKSDPDAGVRGQAAFALGKIGSPRAIPALLEALDQDREVDALGYSPNFIAATALDDILGTSQTRIKVSDTLCKLAPWEPDLNALRKRAQERYAQWTAEARL